MYFKDILSSLREAVTKIYSHHSVDQSTKGGGGFTNLTEINRRKLLKMLTIMTHSAMRRGKFPIPPNLRVTCSK